ncbi:MAG: prefoldin subunit alpha [Thermoplasmata archaeon]|nr:prefoldin subunit alpha [Thermoplasmata archaeon]
MENENALENLLATADVLKKHIENLNLQIQFLREQKEEHYNAKLTLENYLKLENEEILMDIGANTFVYCKVSDKKRAMISIGSNIILEHDIPKAIQTLESRIKDLEEAEKKFIQEADKAQAQYAAIEKRVEEIYNSYKGKGNVQPP